MMDALNSGLYVGHVRHRRLTPTSHAFTYPMFMPLIDLDEIEQLENSVTGFGTALLHFARWRSRDYLRERGDQDLKQAVITKLAELTGETVNGRVLMLCQLRYAGIYFSPINLYYLYDTQGEWRWVLAEVSNTPWNERHYYAVPAPDTWQDAKWCHQKGFHVSPFNPMSQQYRWRLSAPERQLMIHLDIHDRTDNHKIMDATMALKRQPFTSKVLWRLLMKTPVQTVKVVIGIYWQAWRLWLKKVPFYGHPESGDSAVSVSNEASSVPEHQPSWNQSDSNEERMKVTAHEKDLTTKNCGVNHVQK